MQPICRKCSAMATAKAAPSSGSVAEPSSSSSTSECGVAVREMKSMLVTCIKQDQPGLTRLGRPRAAVPTWTLLTLARCVGQGNRHAVVVFGETSFGELQFQFTQNFGHSADCVGVFADEMGHLQQDAMNLSLLFLQQSHELVILLNGFQRLDKDGLPARTRAVSYTLHPPLLLGLYGYNETLTPNGDQFLLNRSAFGQSAQICAQ